MQTILVWLLISLPGNWGANYNPSLHVHVVERFATSEECLRVEKVIRQSTNLDTKLRCVQAAVIK